MVGEGCYLKKDPIISKVEAKYWRTTHNFGIKVPKPVNEACKIHQKLGTTFWTKEIVKGMDRPYCF